MYSVRDVIEQFIRKLQLDVTLNTVMISKNEQFETENLPSLIVHGADILENRSRRTMTKLVVTDEPALTYQQWNHPRFYNFDFQLILTANMDSELLDLQEKIMQFFITNPVLVINAEDVVPMHEITPIGGLDRPNLSNLRQASGKYRLEDLEVYGSQIPENGRLIADRILEYYIQPDETNPVDIRNHPNPNP